MSALVRNLAITLIALTVVTGIFADHFLSIVGLEIPNTTEIRWLLMLGMPIVLCVSYIRVALQPAQTLLDAAIQSIGLIALFLAPYGWVVRHAG